MVPLEMILKTLKRYVKNLDSSYSHSTCNEVVLDILSLDDIAFAFAFYNSSNKFNLRKGSEIKKRAFGC